MTPTKTLAATVLVLLCITICNGSEFRIPTLTIKGSDQKLDLVELHIDVTLEGILAETVLELTYYNHSNRNLEGEFAVQLPEGATVSTYALEVNGEMRPAVSVGKKKARFAYETIKARNIDPGLVERQANNVYRTRIFPILGKKEKKVRIGFIHSIKEGQYTYPFSSPKSLNQYSFRTKGTLTEPPSILLNGQTQSLEKDFDQWALTGSDQKITGKLTAQSSLPTGNDRITRNHFDTSNNRYLMIQGRKPKIQPIDLEKWRKIQVYWDTSLSGAWRNHQSEYDALKQILAKIKNGEIKIQFLGSELSELKTFQFKDGQCDELFTHLDTAVYNGVADFSKLPADLPHKTLVVSDGHITSPFAHAKSGDVFYLVQSKLNKPHSSIAARSLSTINTTSPQWKKQLLSRTMGITAPGINAEDYQYREIGNWYLVTAKTPANWRGRMILGDQNINPLSVNQTEENTSDWNFPRRIWAQEKLAKLEIENNEEKITQLASNERLVSDYTSLIVLELFSDHITFEIPPPEPHLLAKYQRTLKERHYQKTQKLVRSWSRKSNWIKETQNWFDDDFRDTAKLVSIWVRSSNEGFDDETRNQKPIDAYTKWLTTANKTLSERDSLQNASNMTEWMKKMAKISKDLNSISEQKPIADKNKIHVSVRGDVSEYGVYTEPADTNLVDLMDQLGVGDRRVFLYRDAQRTGYDLSSRQAKTELIPLHWGDMIVVTQPPGFAGAGSFLGAIDGFGPVDPFGLADRFESDSSGTDQKLVFESTGGPSQASQPVTPVFSDPDTDQNNDSSSAQVGAPTIPQPANVADLIATITKSKTPDRIYREYMNSNRAALTVEDIIMIATIYFGRDDNKNGIEVLNNLFEVIPNPVKANRTYAYWAAHFGSPHLASKVLNKLAADSTLDWKTKAVIQFDIGTLTEDAQAFKNSLNQIISSENQTELASLAATEYYLSSQQTKLPDLKEFPPVAIKGDLRLLVIGMGQKFEIKIEHDTFSALENSTMLETRGAGISEIMIKKAFPDMIKAKLVSAEPGTYYIKAIRNFGKTNQQISTDTIYINSEISGYFKEYDFKWKDQKVLDEFIEDNFGK